MNRPLHVFLNPGHMPSVDAGCVNPMNGVQETVVAKEIAEKIQFYLQQAGCEVDFLQSDNLNGESPEYPSICGEANATGADIFVSIHCNGCNTEARGTETIVSGSYLSEKLAGFIHKQIVDSIQVIDASFPDRGLKPNTRGLAVLRHTNMPAVLVETAFVDNEKDCELLLKYQDEFARAIARGITDFSESVDDELNDL